VVCESRIDELVSFYWLALCCTVLRSRWCHSGVNRGNSCFTIVLASILYMIIYLN
jgi:hypothetical protein